MHEVCLAHELMRSGLAAKRQIAMPVQYDGIQVELGYRLDILVEDLVVVEVKAVEQLTDVHRAQVISYLKLGGYRLGYLLNFNVTVLRNGMWRITNGL
jgi:GxxExxY protein